MKGTTPDGAKLQTYDEKTANPTLMADVQPSSYVPESKGVQPIPKHVKSIVLT
jgi:hypothetical protein